MSTYSIAVQEFNLLKKNLDPNPDNRPIILEFEKEILALIEKFGESGQSGGSAPYYANVISQTVKKLCMHMPISPITNDDDEWVNITEEMGGNITYQNYRCPAMFKKGNDKPYYLDAIVFKAEEEYDTFTGTVEDIKSRMYIKEFPFMPKTFYIDVFRKPCDISNPNCVQCRTGNFEYLIKDRFQLEEVYEIYEPMK